MCDQAVLRNLKNAPLFLFLFLYLLLFPREFSILHF